MFLVFFLHVCVRLCVYRYEYRLTKEYNWNVKNKASKGYEVSRKRAKRSFTYSWCTYCTYPSFCTHVAPAFALINSITGHAPAFVSILDWITFVVVVSLLYAVQRGFVPCSK